MTKEDCLQTKSRLEDFLDNVTESVYLHQQLDKPVPILDYALQKVSMVDFWSSFSFKPRFLLFSGIAGYATTKL